MRKWLSEIRAAKGMTFKALGERIGKPESYVCNIEHGKMRRKGLDVELLCKIAKAVDVSPVDVLQMEIDYLKET